MVVHLLIKLVDFGGGGGGGAGAVGVTPSGNEWRLGGTGVGTAFPSLQSFSSGAGGSGGALGYFAGGVSGAGLTKWIQLIQVEFQ